MARHSGSSESTVITDARSGRSEDLERRQRNYAVTMAIRTACFFGVVFAPGVFRWICLAGAIVLPWIAVMFVNQVDKRGLSQVPPEQFNQTALPSHRGEQVIPGEVIPDEAGSGPRPTVSPGTPESHPR